MHIHVYPGFLDYEKQFVDCFLIYISDNHKLVMTEFMKFLQDHVTEKFPREAMKLETTLQKVHALLEEFKKHLRPLEEARKAYEGGMDRFVQKELQSVQNAIADMNKKLHKEFRNTIRAIARGFLQAALKRNENDFAELKKSCQETSKQQAETTRELESLKSRFHIMEQAMAELQQHKANIVEDLEEVNAGLCKVEAVEQFWWERAGRPHIPGVTQ
jgi:chromosome segregation ATPase